MFNPIFAMSKQRRCFATHAYNQAYSSCMAGTPTARTNPFGSGRQQEYAEPSVLPL